MQRRHIALAALTLVGSSTLAVTDASATSSQLGQSISAPLRWRAAALNSYRLANRAAYLRGDSRGAQGFRARAAGYLTGWGSPMTSELVTKALAPVATTGSAPASPTPSIYGLATPFDAFQDGTVNGLEVGYTVTAADHLGQMVIEGASAGRIPLTEVAQIRDWLMSLNRVETPLGTCVAYSDSPNDVVTARPDGTIDKCVNNVNASVGMYLTQAARLGVVVPGQTELAASIMRYTGSQVLSNGLWPYMTGVTQAQDLDHNSLNLEAQFVTDGMTPQNAKSLIAQTSAPLTADYTDNLGRIRTVAVDPGYCTTAFPSGQKLMTAIDQVGRTPAGQTTNITTIRYSQVAYYMARGSVLCPKTTTTP